MHVRQHGIQVQRKDINVHDTFAACIQILLRLSNEQVCNA